MSNSSVPNTQTHANKHAQKQSHSRLIRFLSELTLVNADMVSRDFGERLGLLLNFSDSIQLADALKAQDHFAAVADVPAPDTIRATFLRTRGQLVAAIVNSCTPGIEQTRIKWPVVESNAEGISFEPFQRFYLAHQRDMDVGVRALRTSVRDVVAGVSPALQRLVALDIVLEDTLWDHSRRILAVVPRFLEKRFDWLQQQNASRADQTEKFSPDWLLPFSKDIQGFLLAELELRLQPVLGLVEALNNEVIKTT